MMSRLAGLGGPRPLSPLVDRGVSQRAVDYDYIVVGAGAGGAIVASRLAEAGHRVLVLEMGGADHPVETRVPAFHGIASEHPPVALDYGVRHFEDEARARRDSKYNPKLGGVLYPRGEGVGGSTLVNAQIVVLPHRGDWDRMARRFGDPSWSDEGLMWYWSHRIENCQYRPLLRLLHRFGQRLGIEGIQNGGGHGFDGWLSVRQPAIVPFLGDLQIRKIVKAAALQTMKELWEESDSWFAFLRDQALRVFCRFDPNDWRIVNRRGQGLTITPIAMDERGRRSGVRNLLMEIKERYPANLEIKTEALVCRVLFDGKRATGVEILEGANLYRADDEHRTGARGTKRILKAKKGVILAAGAYGTAQILQLSGIGPQEELRRHGIEAIADLPVGRNLHDRYEVPVICRLQRDFSILRGATFRPDPRDPHFRRWREQGTGIYATNGVVVSAIRKSHPDLEQPDLFNFLAAASFAGYYEGYSRDATEAGNAITWLVLKARTENRGGTVTLRSADPQEPPDVNFHYFEEGRDHGGRPLTNRDGEALVAGVKMVRRIDDRLGRLVTAELRPGPGIDDDRAIEAWAKDEAWGHHATGTTAEAIDGKLHLPGIENLWISDASVFLDIPGFFLVSAVMMMAEKAGDMILEEADSHRRERHGLGPPPPVTGRTQRAIPERPTRRQRRALSRFFTGTTDDRSIAALGRHVPISAEARERIPTGQRDFYRAVKLLQAEATGRDTSEITEHAIEGAGIRVTDPLSGQVTEVSHSLFGQRWEARNPNGDVLVISPAYQATGRWWTPLASAASLEGMTVLAMDHVYAGFSAGRPGRFDGASLAGAIALTLADAERLRTEQGGRGNVRMVGESLGATALLMGVILAYNGKVGLTGGTLPKDDLYLALVNPYLGKLSNPFAAIAGHLLKHLPFSLPTREFLTDVVKDPDAERRFDHLAALENVRVHPSGLVRSNKLIQHVMAGLEKGQLRLPPNLKFGLLLTRDDASIDRQETARLVRLLKPNLVYERTIEGRDHSIVLNDKVQHEIEALVRAFQTG